MPVKRRKAKQRREAPDRIRQYFREEIEYTFFHDDAEIAAAWDQIGQEIVADWILTRPGTRPMAWWRHSAPEPGRTSGGVAVSDRGASLGSCVDLHQDGGDETRASSTRRCRLED